MSNDPLPDRDPTKKNAQQGLYGKFLIERTDGSSATGGKHHGCQYFVLDVTHDKHAATALAAYAGAVAATHPQLAADMRERYGLHVQPSEAMLQPDSNSFEEWRADSVMELQRPNYDVRDVEAMLDWLLPACWSAAIASSRPAGDAAMPVVAIYSPDEPVDEDGDVRMPVVDLGDSEALAYKRRISPHRTFDGLVSQRAAQAATASLQADLVEERNRIASMRTEWAAEVEALTAQARHAKDHLAAVRQELSHAVSQAIRYAEVRDAFAAELLRIDRMLPAHSGSVAHRAEVEIGALRQENERLHDAVKDTEAAMRKVEAERQRRAKQGPDATSEMPA